jgi:hypothetical protein
LKLCSPNGGARNATASPNRRTPAPSGLPGRAATISTRVAA